MCQTENASFFCFVRGGTKSCPVLHPEWNLGVRLCQPIHRILSGDLGQRTEPAYRHADTGTVAVSGRARASEQPNATGAAAQWVLHPSHSHTACMYTWMLNSLLTYLIKIIFVVFRIDIIMTNNLYSLTYCVLVWYDSLVVFSCA